MRCLAYISIPPKHGRHTHIKINNLFNSHERTYSQTITIKQIAYFLVDMLVQYIYAVTVNKAIACLVELDCMH